jgi:hypothetical protein
LPKCAPRFLGPRYKVTTLQDCLVKKSYNDQGDQILVRINKYVPPINFYQIILIDEGSMVNDETAKELIGYVKEGNKALIVLGDYCQLPPVNQETDSYSLKTFLQSLPYQCDFKVRCTIS